MFTVNLEKVLVSHKQKTLIEANAALEKTNQLLAKEEEIDSDILYLLDWDARANALRNARNTYSNTKEFLEQEGRKFEVAAIKDICVKYRLRFLSANKYKGKIENKVVLAIKDYCKEYNLPINSKTMENFFVVAPAKAFKLEMRPKPIDPLLFYKIGHDSYELICKWGNDINIFRKLLVMPMRGESWYIGAHVLLWLSIILILQLLEITFGTTGFGNIIGSTLISGIFVIIVGMVVWAVLDDISVDLSDKCWNSIYKSDKKSTIPRIDWL